MIKPTSREKEVLYHLLRERDLAKVAETLGVTVSTVKFHKQSLFRKLCIKKPLELLAVAAAEHGLVDLQRKGERENEVADERGS